MAGRAVRMTRGQLRQLVTEEVGRLAEAHKKGAKGKKKEPAKKRSFEEWRNELDKVLDKTGYGSVSDTPAFDHLSSENQAAADAAEEILRTLYDAGTSEQDAAEALDAGDRFWEDHGYDVDALAAEDREDDEDDEDDGHDTGEDESALEDESDERILGDLMNGYVTGVGMDREKLEDHLRRLGATPEEVDTIMDAAARLEAAYSEASASPEEHNQTDWDEAEADITAAFEALGVTTSLSDMHVYFPVEQWREGMEDREEDDEEDAESFFGEMTVDEMKAAFPEAWEQMTPDIRASVEAGAVITRTAEFEFNVDASTKVWTYSDMDGWTSD